MAEEPQENVCCFGRTNFRNTYRLFGVKRKDRRQHMYVIGKTGTGKSALLHNLIVQDISNGEGLCVVDPHGELVESLLEKIPEDRLDDVIYFNPADSDFHIGFNVLELPDPKYKHLVASGLMGIFTKMWANVWSARMEYILNNAILALLDTPGTTLLGINRILVDKDYRQRILDNVKDPVVKAFWTHEYEEWRDQFRNEAIAPIQNKVGQFLSTSLIRNIVGQQKSTIDIFKIMNEGKIFLINVSKGKIGEDNSSLLGSMLITKIQLAAMERVRVPEDERVDFFLYVDEFQNFATESFANILSEARKYRLDLILAHQYIGQLISDTSTKVRDAVFGNAGTLIVFRTGAADAEFLEKEFEPEFNIQDLVNLPNYCIYLKLMVDGVTSRPFSANTLPPFNVPTSAKTPELILENSRAKYAVPNHIVEEEVAKWSSANVSPKIEAQCAACGDSTTLNFEPIEGKAIYCKNCLKKIKDGKLKRVPDEKDFKSRPRSKYFTDLSAIGIDIGVQASKPPTPSRPPRQRDSRNDQRSKPGQTENSNKPTTNKSASILDRVDQKFSPNQKNEQKIRLSDLKNQQEIKKKKRVQKQKTNIDELRKSLRSILDDD